MHDEQRLKWAPSQGGDPGHHDRVHAGILRWLPARRAPDVPGQHLGCLIAKVTQQHAGAGSDPEGEVRATMLAVLQLGDRRQELINDSLAARPYCRQRLLAVTARTHASSPAQTTKIHKGSGIPSPRSGHESALGGAQEPA